ncbi:MAG TPA: TetR family transcriptional regulator [Solirubrobacteraceae bacterium]|jgi:AcrR family transcriptional regulator|nr:TetR family transcriptional regulator [Solirubrobacteraceae bacterium]
MPSRNAGAGARSRRPGSESGLAATRVAEIQRQRLLAAMAAVASERGAANASVTHVVSRAGVSRRTFYELFEDREACFLAAFDQAVARAAETVLPAYEGETRWRERVRAGLAALLHFLDAEPGMARLVVVEALGAGPRSLEHRARVLAALIAAVDEGRSEMSRTRPPKEPPPLTAEGVVGAVFAVIHARIVLGPTRPASQPLTELLGELMGVIVLPYLGPSSAQKELHRPAPPPQKKTPQHRDPLEGLRMRLTYRTLRALAAVAAHPGASNRKLAEAAGIVDQGQASKLFTRLEDLGLIENTGEGHAKGARNAWVLTSKGEQVAQSMS